MRYLIYSYCFETPHFETDMEIALKLIEDGNEVYFLVCKGELKTCFINPEHQSVICGVCKSKIVNGLKRLNIAEDKILRFPALAVDSSEYEKALISFEDLRNFKYGGSDIGLGVVSSLITLYRDHVLDMVKYEQHIKVGLETAIMVHKVMGGILDELNPDVVVMFNGRFIECRPILRLCEGRKINFITHERGGHINRYMFRENTTPHSLDFSKEEIENVWGDGDEDKIRIGKSFFEERRERIVQTWHVFTDSQVQGHLPESFDQNKRNVGIFNSSMDEYESIPDFYNRLYLNDNDGIEQLLKSFLVYPKFHFYLRIHPSLKGLENTQVKQLEEFSSRYSNLTLIPADHHIDSYALMDAVESVVSFGSTMGIEALYWGKPSVLLGRAYYEGLNGFVVPNVHADAVEAVLNPITPKNLSAIKYGYWCLTFGKKFEFFEADGLFSGKFLGKRIKASFVSRLKRRIFAKT